MTRVIRSTTLVLSICATCVLSTSSCADDKKALNPNARAVTDVGATIRVAEPMHVPASTGACPEVVRHGMSAVLHDGANAVGLTTHHRRQLAHLLPEFVQAAIWSAR